MRPADARGSYRSRRHRLNDYLIKEGGHVGYGIRPSHQRQGYGRLILALALEECRRLDIRRVLVIHGGSHQQARRAGDACAAPSAS